MSNRVNTEAISIDKRVLTRKFMQGEISEKDLQNITKKLPDVAENAEEVYLNENEKKNETEINIENKTENEK
jgi:hypothetical protein